MNRQIDTQIYKLEFLQVQCVLHGGDILPADDIYALRVHKVLPVLNIQVYFLPVLRVTVCSIYLCTKLNQVFIVLFML